MGYILKKKDGTQIIRPITFPATDEQVKDQLQKLIDDNEFPYLIGTTQRIDELTVDIKGDTIPEEDINISWSIGVVNETNGNVDSDSQNMRIRSNKITAIIPIKIIISNTTKYKYQRYWYDELNHFIGYDTSWMSAREFTIPRGKSCIIKVRESSYVAWDSAKISDFASTVNAEWSPKDSLNDKFDDLSSTVSEINEIKTNVQNLTSKVSALEETQNGETNILFTYDENALSPFEYGVLSWENGNTYDDSSQTYVRSKNYYFVDNEYTFIPKINDSSIISYYAYSYNGSSYTFSSASEWKHNGESFKPTKGLYYKALINNTNGLTLSENSIVMTASIIGDAINSAISGTANDLLNESLTNAESIEMNRVISEINTDSKDPGCAIIAWMTDLHFECGTLDEDISGTNITRTKKHFTMYNKIADKCEIDMLMLGGDYLQNSSSTSKAYATNALSYLGKLLKKINHKSPIAILKGNHDDNTMYTDAINGYVDDQTRWNLFAKEYYTSTKREVEYIEKMYGYYDIPDRKIRVFYLNTIDVNTTLDTESNSVSNNGQNTTGFSKEQLQFIVDNLKFDESGWQVVFFSHHPIKRNPFPSPMSNVGVVSTHGGEALEQILQAFMFKSSGAVSCNVPGFEFDVSYNFMNNKSNTIIACINGHTHYDCAEYIDGINWIATRAIDGHSTYSYTDTSVYIVINRRKRKLYLISNGDGEDRVIDY